MSNLALMAATEWARANAPQLRDPVEFGNKVALAYLACRDTQYQEGDEKTKAASLAALSIPLEVLQRLAQVSSLLAHPVRPGTDQTDSAGA